MVSPVKLPATALPRPQPNTPSYQLYPTARLLWGVEMRCGADTQTREHATQMEMPMRHVSRHAVTLEATCMTCDTTHEVSVLADDYEHYALTHDLVQNVWPCRTTWEREVIIGYRTGVFQCKKCCDAQQEE